MYTIGNQYFGIELEFSGISRETAVNTLVRTFRRRSAHGESPYGPNLVKDRKDRVWKIVKDNSVVPIGEDGWPNELVSPKLTFEDMPLIKQVIQALKDAGAQVNESCGFHVHVDFSPYNFRALKNLVGYYAEHEEVFYKALGVYDNRAAHHAQPFTKKHEPLVKNLNSINDMDSLSYHWYMLYGGEEERYSGSRYCGFNLHRVWFESEGRKTIEFRLFNGTLDLDEIEAYITLSLAVSAKALNTRRNVVASRKEIAYNDQVLNGILAGLGIEASNEMTSTTYRQLIKYVGAAS